jgi:hypothetical protein
MKHNTKSERYPELLQELYQLILAHRAAFKQERTFLRAMALLMGELFSFARHTVTQGLLALGLTDADWSAWYRLFSRQRFTEALLAHYLFVQTLRHVAPTQPYVIGVDVTQVPRASLKMPGTSWLKASGTAAFRPGIHRAQRFLNGSWLLPIEVGYSRAIPLRFLPAFPEKAVPAESPACKEWEAGLQMVAWTRTELNAAGRAEQLLLTLGDGAYDREGFWRGLPPGVAAVVRTAKNRRLRGLLSSYSGRGTKNRKYGADLPHPNDWLAVRQGWQEQAIWVRGRQWQLTYRIEGPLLRQGCPDRPLFLLVIRGHSWKAGKKEGKRKYRKPAFYLISALPDGDGWRLPLAEQELLEWVWQRWELEVTHRELKSGLGLGEKQCWNSRSAVLSVQWSAWVYAVLVLAGFRTWGLFGGPHPPGRWWPGARRWSLTTLWRSYRAAFWGTPEFRAVWTGTGDNWLKKEAWIAGLYNAIAAAARI